MLPSIKKYRDSCEFPWKPLVTLLVGGFIAAGIAGCASSSASEAPYPALYQQHVAEFDTRSGTAAQPETDLVDGGQAALRKQFAGFIAFFEALEPEDIAVKTEAIYAKKLYFNDTLKTFTDRDALIEYLDETAHRVEYNRVNIINIIPFGDDYFMQWHMESGFKVFGKLIKSESIGMTHVRVDQDGKVNFHQDFWDNTEGLFRHLPGVGYVVTKTRNRL